MQFAGNFAAFIILQRHDTFSEPLLLGHRFTQCAGKMVELGADRSNFGRTGGRDAGIVMPGLDTGHRIRQRLDRRQGPADDDHRDQQQRCRDGRANLQLRHDSIPYLGDFIARMRGDQQAAIRFALNGNGNADAGLFGAHQRNEPFGRRIEAALAQRRVARSGNDTLTGTFMRDTDMAQLLQTIDDRRQLGFGIGAPLQVADRCIDEFARQPKDAIVLRLNARPRLKHQPTDIGRKADDEHQSEQQVQARPQGKLLPHPLAPVPRYSLRLRRALTDEICDVLIDGTAF